MSKQSDKVKDWRKRTKERLVEAFGGKCCICGFEKYKSALEFHHLDPSEKDSLVSKWMANPKSWEKIVNECRKCVCVCSNCHKAIHNEGLKVPKSATRFDESFAEYKEGPKVDPCPICRKMKPIRNFTCSYECAAQRSGKLKFSWADIDLLEELKTKSKAQVARELGCSDAAVGKRYRKLISK
jgi:hypothetical protein